MAQLPESQHPGVALRIYDSIAATRVDVHCISAPNWLTCLSLPNHVRQTVKSIAAAIEASSSRSHHHQMPSQNMVQNCTDRFFCTGLQNPVQKKAPVQK
jgi:hypothetical protein